MTIETKAPKAENICCQCGKLIYDRDNYFLYYDIGCFCEECSNRIEQYSKKNMKKNMKNNKNIWLCIKDCNVEISAEGSHLFYSAGEFIEEEFAPKQSCFLSVTKTQRRQLQTILNSIAKEKKYQEKQRLIIYNSHPRGNWKAEQRLNGSIQEARSTRERFNKVVSDIAGKDIEVFWDCKGNDKLRW